MVELIVISGHVASPIESVRGPASCVARKSGFLESALQLAPPIHSNRVSNVQVPLSLAVRAMRVHSSAPACTLDKFFSCVMQSSCNKVCALVCNVYTFFFVCVVMLMTK